MPSKKSTADRLLRYWPLITTGCVLLGALLSAVVTLQRERDTLLRKLDEQCTRIDILERITGTR